MSGRSVCSLVASCTPSICGNRRSTGATGLVPRIVLRLRWRAFRRRRQLPEIRSLRDTSAVIVAILDSTPRSHHRRFGWFVPPADSQAAADFRSSLVSGNPVLKPIRPGTSLIRNGSKPWNGFFFDHPFSSAGKMTYPASGVWAIQ